MNITDLTMRYHHPRMRKRSTASINRIVLHHDAGRRPSEKSKVLPRLDAYDRQHDDVGGLPYHYVIDPWGEVYKCRQTSLVTAHARGGNTTGVAIMLMGYFHKDNNYQGERPTPAQLDSLLKLVPELVKNIPTIKMLTPHKDVPGARTACPGNRFPYEIVEKLRKSCGLT